MKDIRRYGMKIDDSLIEADDLGIVNRHITMNGWRHDLAEIRGLYAPPYFSREFRLEIRFDGRRIPARECFWQPCELTRKGVLDGLRFTSSLVLAAGRRAAILKIVVANPTDRRRNVEVQYEVSGALKKQEHWGFNFPKGALKCYPELRRDTIVTDAGEGAILIAPSIKVAPDAREIFNGETLVVPPRGETAFCTVLAAGPAKEAEGDACALRRDPEKAIADARAEWKNRVTRLEAAMPRFSSDLAALERLYDRSLLHLLLNEWDVPEWKLHPYYATGGINGGCCASYLWNYGEPYRLWSILDPEAAKRQLAVYLDADLTAGFAFYPDDGTLFGPYYPVNQEKALLLAHAYVTQTRDTAFLKSKCGTGERVIDRLCREAMMHDDPSRDAVPVDYGDGNHHLELRGELRYDGTVPDLNLRRCVNYHICAALCRIAKVKPPVPMEERAEALKKIIEERLYDPRHKWFRAIDPQGKPYLRWTIQLFKALGWGDWALSPRSRKALLSHLNEAEFLGKYGMHSLAKGDPAYDPADIDNGGPGGCISFAPAVVNRLYRDGEEKLAWDIFRRLLWLADKLPYWGDSHTADRMEYRRDTPLQNDIQGAALAQTIIFGLFGIDVDEKFTVTVAPHLPADARRIALDGLRIAGKTISVRVKEGFFTVVCDGKRFTAAAGERIVLP